MRRRAERPAGGKESVSMSDIEPAIEKLRRYNKPVPAPLSLPGEQDVAAMESQLGVFFQPDYRTYLLKASDVVFGAVEPATITAPESHTYLPKVIACARDYGVPDSLFPFREDNGDFFCLTSTGEVEPWSHDCSSDETWSSLGSWIEQMWIEENA
jgi:hypothetical protein